MKMPWHLWLVGIVAVLFNAIGVFGALLASILLLLRRKLALPVFVVSLAAFFVSLWYTYVLANGGAVVGPQMAIVSVVIAGLLIFFGAYSHLPGIRRRRTVWASVREKASVGLRLKPYERPATLRAFRFLWAPAVN